MGMGNILEEREDIRQRAAREKKRRSGYKFIRVINTVYPTYNRLHSVEDIELFEMDDTTTGGKKSVPREVSMAITFQQDPVTTDWFADVLDTERNRFFLARHLELGIEVEDERIREQIEGLVHKEYKVELSATDEKKRKITQLRREIRHIEEDEEKAVRKAKEKENRMQSGIRPVKDKEKAPSESIQIPEDTTTGV